MQNNSSIKQNILQYIDYLNISRRDFYSNTGISRGTLESPTGITEDTLWKFIVKYPKVRIEWLIKGTGNMLDDEINIAEESDTKYQTNGGEIFRLKTELETAKKKINELQEELLVLYRIHKGNEINRQTG
jgi:hypothetical protein